MALASVQDVLSFWFDELTPQQWFNTFARGGRGDRDALCPNP